MNYQLLVEYYSIESEFLEQEIKLLELEFFTQMEKIKISSNQGFLKVAPNHICDASNLCRGSLWITCLAAVLDALKPNPSEAKARTEMVLNELSRKAF